MATAPFNYHKVAPVEVHLHDANGHKSGSNDKHCLMEARIAGHQPLAVSHDADDLDAAISGAAEKLAGHPA